MDINNFISNSFLSFISGGVIISLTSLLFRQRYYKHTHSLTLNSNAYGFINDTYLSDMLENDRKEINERMISKQLQRLGINAYFGQIPLQYTLAICANTILKDWNSTFNHTYEKIRKTTIQDTIEKVPYDRRHAEWIAIIAYYYIKSSSFHINGYHLKTISDFENNYGNDKHLIKQIEANIYRSEKNHIPRSVKYSRKKILGNRHFNN